MSKNRVYAKGDDLSLPVPAGTVSGNPVAVGQIPGVARTDRRANGEASVEMDGVFRLPVVGNNGAAAAAIPVGGIVYLNGATLNANNAGVRFGYALEPVAAGETKQIQVKIGY
jgi:predicted RecA/RadA family phage recombinase